MSFTNRKLVSGYLHGDGVWFLGFIIKGLAPDFESRHGILGCALQEAIWPDRVEKRLLGSNDIMI